MHRKRSHKLIIFLVCISVFFISFYILYNYFLKSNINENNMNKNISKNNEKVEYHDISKIKLKTEPHLDIKEPVKTTVSQEDTIKSYTKIVYQYYYEVDNKLVENVTQPTYYLLNMNKKQLEECYPDWQIQSFSINKVVLRKNLAQRNKDGYFTIGVYEGYICVFCEDGSIRELTQTSINSLPLEEQAKLKKGIKVYGEDKLVRMLEDYTS